MGTALDGRRLVLQAVVICGLSACQRRLPQRQVAAVDSLLASLARPWFVMLNVGCIVAQMPTPISNVAVSQCSFVRRRKR